MLVYFQVMKESKGKANPVLLNKILLEKLKSSSWRTLTIDEPYAYSANQNLGKVYPLRWNVKKKNVFGSWSAYSFPFSLPISLKLFYT